MNKKRAAQEQKAKVMHQTAEGQEVSRQGVERPTGSDWVWATGGGHSKLSLVGHAAEMLCTRDCFWNLGNERDPPRLEWTEL